MGMAFGSLVESHFKAAYASGFCYLKHLVLGVIAMPIDFFWLISKN